MLIHQVLLGLGLVGKNVQVGQILKNTPSLSENGYYYWPCENGTYLGSELITWSDGGAQSVKDLEQKEYVVTRYTGWFDSAVYAKNR